MEDYYIAQDESKAGAIKENGTNHSENEKYYGSQANIKKVIERKGRVREQTPKLRIEVLESAEQCNEGYLSNIKPKKEKTIESVEQNRDDDFDEIEFYYDTQGEPHIDSEKEMNDSDEEDIISAKSIKQQYKRHVRKLRIINENHPSLCTEMREMISVKMKIIMKLKTNSMEWLKEKTSSTKIR